MSLCFLFTFIIITFILTVGAAALFILQKLSHFVFIAIAVLSHSAHSQTQDSSPEVSILN